MKTHTASMSDLEHHVVTRILASGGTATLGLSKRLSVRLETAIKKVTFLVEELYDGQSDPHWFDELEEALAAYNEV
jgi:hypothetical protein